MRTVVIATYSDSGILIKLGDTKDFGETICHLLNSDGFSGNLHKCFYIMSCVFVQVMIFIQVPAVVDVSRAARKWACVDEGSKRNDPIPDKFVGGRC